MKDSRSGLLIIAVSVHSPWPCSDAAAEEAVGIPRPRRQQLGFLVRSAIPAIPTPKRTRVSDAKIFSFLGYPTNAYAAAGPTVDMVIAIPMLRGDLEANK